MHSLVLRTMIFTTLLWITTPLARADEVSGEESETLTVSDSDTDTTVISDDDAVSVSEDEEQEDEGSCYGDAEVNRC